MFIPFMDWNETYSVKIGSLDDQHKKIINMINDLYDLIERGKDRKKLDEILVRLSVYTIKHFIFEESLFKKHGYKYQKEHKKEHDDLAERVTEFHKRHTIQKKEIQKNLLEFFKDQIVNHIMSFDQKYIDFMSNHEVK